MSSGRADISASANELYQRLRDQGIDLPRRESVAQYRLHVRAGFEAYVQRALEGFDGRIDTLEIAGVPCRQLTPAGWSEADGPCLVYAYGGGFVSGSTHEDQIIAAPLSKFSAARVVMVEYALAPECPYPAAREAMRRVYQALAAAHGAKRLVVGGESAGGNLALGLLQQLRDDGLEQPRCAVLLSPWCDLSNQGDSHAFNEGRDPSLNNAWVDIASAWYAADTAVDDPGVSPLCGDLQGLPPIMITSATRDLLLSQCLRLARRLRAAGVDCDLRVWEGLWHVFEFYPVPEADRSLAEMAAFIRAHSAA